MEWINNCILIITDPAFNWILLFPKDISLLIVALLTSLILIGVRKITTNQGLLKNCKEDKAVLKGLLKQAKKNKDTDAIKRHRDSLTQIGLVSLISEGKPLLVSLLPIALLATWAFSRIGYIPPKKNEPVIINSYFDAKSVGDYVYIKPKENVFATTGWIQKIKKDIIPPDPAPEWVPQIMSEILGYHEDGIEVGGVASWEMKTDKTNEKIPFDVIYKDEKVNFDLLVGDEVYVNPFVFLEDSNVICIETKLKDYKALGIIPGIPLLLLQPWIIAYLLIVIPLSFILKPLLRIY